jgi:two-component system chemotaxis response regulator CheB
MPRSAASICKPDFLLPAADIPDVLVWLSGEFAEKTSERAGAVTAMAMEELERPIAFNSPEWGGALKPVPQTGLKHYSCHIGHRFGDAEVLQAQVEGVEKASTLRCAC